MKTPKQEEVRCLTYKDAAAAGKRIGSSSHPSSALQRRTQKFERQPLQQNSK
ncbi:hypothetical protein [Mesorhizobium sp.]|uniref:hypothetical protein n=1 Tax=Mesorhizobium sp. TaxID=1871066 RepID=UPI0025F44F60|nr:hypothetical protein [Mesorhizobium sp.]